MRKYLEILNSDKEIVGRYEVIGETVNSQIKNVSKHLERVDSSVFTHRIEKSKKKLKIIKFNKQ